MKRNLYAVMAVLAVTVGMFGLKVVQAACIGGTALCFDDTTVSINGVPNDGTGMGTVNLTTAAANSIAPRAKGQEIYCTSCTNGGGFLGSLCVSTGTGIGAYVLVGSATAVTGCK